MQGLWAVTGQLKFPNGIKPAAESFKGSEFVETVGVLGPVYAPLHQLHFIVYTCTRAPSGLHTVGHCSFKLCPVTNANTCTVLSTHHESQVNDKQDSG